MAGRGIPIKNAVEVDLLDGMDCELHHYRTGATSNVSDVVLGEEGRWTTHSYACGRSWSESYYQNGGWYYWNPIEKWKWHGAVKSPAKGLGG